VMAQKIVTVCDAHQLHEEEVEGQSWEVSIRPPGAPRATTWEVDLCTDDGKTLVDLGAMLDAVGRVTEGPRRKASTAARNTPRTDAQAHAAPMPTRARRKGANTAALEVPHTAEGWPCPVEGCTHVSTTRSALGVHVRARHDQSLAEALGVPTPYVCDVCEKQFSHPQGLGAHRRAAHGLSRHVRAEESGAA